VVSLVAPHSQPLPGTQPGGGLLLEISSCLRLFGGLDALHSCVAERFAQTGYQGQIGIAPTPEAARLLARCGVETPIVDLQHLPDAIAALPLGGLEWPAEISDALQGVGVERIGALQALPREQLARRFGPDTIDRLERLMGERPDPRPVFQPPATFRRKLELLYETDSGETLLFPLRRLCIECEGYLRARCAGVSQLTIYLETRAALIPLKLGFAAPEYRAKRFVELIRERLLRVQLDAPVHAIQLHASRLTACEQAQAELFSARAQIDTHWRELLEGLSARLGEDTVRGLGLAADHRPEARWRWCVPGERTQVVDGLPRPLWLLETPRCIARFDRLLAGPERIESGWWDGQDVHRDYYLAQCQGARLWVFRDRNDGRWYLHGVWA
jgi:protein ImuB